MASTHVILIKGGCQSGRKVIPHNSKSDLHLVKFVKTTNMWTATAAESRKKQDAAVQPLPKMRSQQSFDEISRL